MKMVIKELCKTVILLGCIIIGFNNSLAQNTNGSDETFLELVQGHEKLQEPKRWQ